MSGRSARLGLAVLLVAGTVGLGAGVPASAHATLVGSVPAAGSTVTDPPRSVTLEYDENVRSPSTVIVTGPDGRRVDRGGTRAVDNTAAVDVAVRLAGRYRVAYRVISADGHPVSGTTSFSFQGAGAPKAAGSVGPAASSGPSHRGLVVGGAAGLVLVAAVGLMVGRRATTARAPTSPEDAT